MPNWTHNIVQFDGTEDNLKKIKERLFTKGGDDKPDNVFDFNKIIPMPEHSATFFRVGSLGEQEREKFGHNNWYDWSIYNWGTKWNSVRAEIAEESDGFITYHFDSAWDAPRPIIQEICNNGMLDNLKDFSWSCAHEFEEELEEIIKTIACADYI